MRRKQWARLAAVLLTAGTMGIGILPIQAENGNNAGGRLEINDNGTYTDRIYGWYKIGDEDAVNGHVMISGNATTFKQSIYGGYSDSGNALENTVIISDSNLKQGGFGGYVSGNGNVTHNSVWLTGNTTAASLIYGGYSNGTGNASNNNVILTDNVSIESMANIVGGRNEDIGLVSNNTVIVKDNVKVNTVGMSGGYSHRNGTVMNNQVIISDFAEISGGDTSYVRGGGSDGDSLVSKNSVIISDKAKVFIDIYGGKSQNGIAKENIVSVTGGTVQRIFGGYSELNTTEAVVEGNQVLINQGEVKGDVYGGYALYGNSEKNLVSITSGQIENNVRGGYSKDAKANNNIVQFMGGTMQSNVIGGQGTDADNNKVILLGGKFFGQIIGGSASKGTPDGNLIQLSNDTDVSNAELYGANKRGATGNTLVIDDWKNNTTKVVRGFNGITFKSVQWENGGIALNITNEQGDNQLNNTVVTVNNLILSSNKDLHVNDVMTFIQSSAKTGLSIDNISVNEHASFTQGVTAIGELEMQLKGDTDNLIGKITNVERNPQTDIILDSRSAGTAFVNQGADIAAESLDLMSDDYKYGVRTFGAVYGSRSKYDVNSDLKINGWNTIVGVGNVHRKGDADLAWGVFYENGTGNYRTENSFNDEFFRGDGSLVYNGGGAAVRYKKDSGMYYEASLRVGTLNSSMSNAVKDGDGNSYGYDSDSTYWGTHVGIGKLMQSGSGEWNLYGKYFHTEVEGDQFSIAGDAFSFDDVTSDRLRLGARYTADTANKWSLYYGLAWEYEFNGDSHMKAGQFDAPEQSLKGSTGIAEIGTVWRSDDSPWRADINLKGYTGEREGFSGMVHLTYLF